VLRMVGACHQSRRSLPPPPRLVGTNSAPGCGVCAWAGVEVASRLLRKGPDSPSPIMYRRKARRSAMPCATRCTQSRKAASSRLMTPPPLPACRASYQHAGYLHIPGEPTVTQAQGDVKDTGSAHPSKGCRSVYQLPALIMQASDIGIVLIGLRGVGGQSALHNLNLTGRRIVIKRRGRWRGRQPGCTAHQGEGHEEPE